MNVNFTKMHSFSNDFVIMEKKVFKKKIIKLLSNRKTGVGFDQIFFVEKINFIYNNIFCRIFNSDGSEAGTCFNGLKCLGNYINKKYKIKYFKAFIKENCFDIEVKNNKVKLISKVIDFSFKRIGFKFLLNKMFFFIQKENLSINFFLNKKKYFSTIYVGNPHAVFFSKENLKKILLFFNNNIFTNGVNISYFSNSLIVTLERGAGFTNSCGSATASIAITLFQRFQKKIFEYKKKNEKMVIKWDKGHFCKKKIILIGKGNFVFSGKIKL